jgi:uncharacterized membrane protein (UPF0182 family)
MRWGGIAAAIVFILALLIGLGLVSDFLVDWLWFSSIGYFGVFWVMFRAKAALFLAVLAASALALWVNAVLASRFAGPGRPWPPAPPIGGIAGGPGIPEALLALIGPTPRRRRWHLAIAGAAILLGMLIAWTETSDWNLVLRFVHQSHYGQSDPLFGRDIGFYLFSLPAYMAIKNWMLTTLFFGAAAAGAVYWVHGDIILDHGHRRIAPAVIGHGSALLGLFFVVKAWSYALDRYLLLYGDNGVVVGAGYTDIHVELPVIYALIGLAVIAAGLAFANIWLRRWKLLTASLALVFGFSFLAAEIFPALFQRLYVKPNELQLETPYIEQNIALTREAFNLRQIAVKPFPAEEGLTFQSLKDNSATIDNIKLWDWQPLMDTYAQLQEIRTYYKFHDVNVDRYELGGAFQQMNLSARELEPSLLPANAQTWLNQHLIFTHGNGVVMSPVTKKSAEGLPVLYLQDIPPIATGGPEVREPRIYYGETSESYVFVKTTTQEFDYPKGKDNVYASYAGKGGVPIGNAAVKSLFAWHFDDPNILLSSYVTNDSRILFRRNIGERVATIAPFLRLDHDPYVVVSEGRLFWIQDAYTRSEWFPYAQHLQGGRTNYIRNSVKVVIDAYDGSVDFYVADSTDPILATYTRVFRKLFKPLSAMPPDLQKHIRYPEDLFLIQAQMYKAYHMEAPEVFYNREDLWQFPREATSVGGFARSGASTEMPPYYINMRLPGEARTEFFLMLPMVPSQRENMIAWLAARCDAPDYGKLIVYEFPKEKLVYGPFQIEARINQNTEISQQLSLWNQMGSRVIRGNLLVVPIENSILYVSPLYLRAETGQLPELKRVIAAYDDRVVMEETLSGALAALFRETAPAAARPGAQPEPGSAAPADAKAREALEHYRKAIERLKDGDWAGFGTEFGALEPILEALAGGR